MKTKRQRKIIELITNYDIETQEELAAKLVENGFNVTQATISRDIRELNLTKIATKGGKQKYAVQSSSDIVSNSKYMRVNNGYGRKYTCSKNSVRNGNGSGCST